MTVKSPQAEGYFIARRDLYAGPTDLWDGEVHATLEAAERSLSACEERGDGDWKVYALVDPPVPHPLVGRTFTSRDPREAGRKIRIEAWDESRGKYRVWSGATRTHISASTLKTKWREVSE